MRGTSVLPGLFVLSAAAFLWLLPLSSFAQSLDPPVASHPSGFFTETFELTLSTEVPDGVIRYTRDGSTPQETSPIYTAPMLIADRFGEPDFFSTIPTSPQWRSPLGEVYKATVIRASVFRDGFSPSPSITRTYFVDPEIYERYTLPVFSLVTDPENFFDHQIGIYVPGISYDPGDLNSGNYSQRGDQWERPVHLSLFEPDGVLKLDQGAGVRIHGGAATRSLPQKTLRLYARSEYGANVFQCPLFPNHYTEVFERFLLRNSGDDWVYTLFRDGLIHTLAENLNLDQQAYRPSILFLNGEYWGIHNIRERLDATYLAYRHGVPAGNLDYLTNDREVIEGDAVHYNAMLDFLQGSDLSQPGNYAHLRTMMDTDNFASYQALQIYIGNMDWPHNNIDCWRLRTDTFVPDAPHGHDGRWRWILYDLDESFGYYSTVAYTYNNLQYALRDGRWETFLFRKLLENSDFRAAFITQMANHMNTLLRPDVVVGTIESLRDAIAPFMPEHMDRWTQPPSMEDWQDHIQVMIEFASERPGYIRQHVMNHFGLPGLANVTLNLSQPGSGTIRIGTLEVDARTKGIVSPDAPYPWTGEYFRGVPVRVEAVPTRGYEFSHWEGLPDGTPAMTEIEFSEDLSLTAHFSRLPEKTFLHLWHFNDLPDGVLQTVPANGGILGTGTLSYPGTGNGYMDSVLDGTEINARPDDPAGLALRVRNPSHTRALLLNLPTTRFEKPVLRYAVKRTPSGAREHRLLYRTHPTGEWIGFGENVTVSESYQLVTFDFSDVESVSDNPDFCVSLIFLGTEAMGDSGNNRFDNLSLEGEIIPFPSASQMQIR